LGVQISPAAHMTKAKNKKYLKIIFLGGLGEVGRNMTLLEYENKILIIDMGLRFPEETMPGIDCIIPNTSYLEKKRSQIVGAVFTHGHYDHIGAIPYIINKLDNNFPLFTAPLTKGIVLKRQEDFPQKPSLDIKEIKNGSRTNLGSFSIEWVRVNHNIPDTFGLFIRTPVGNIFYASDFKFDPTPIYDPPIDFKRLRKIGNQGILLLMSDSTGAEEAGHSLSEKEIMGNLEEIFKRAENRIIAASFASLLNRIQQIVTLSEKYKRKVAIDGYSMKRNVEIAQKLGYFKIKPETKIEPKEVKKYPDSKVTILCTGAQGEERAVLMRLANKEHRFLGLKKGDTVILSSSVVPGNERSVQILKDNLLRQGAKVFHYEMMDIHTGGHAQQEELKEMIKIMKPRFFIPVHGQYSMLVAHSQIAREAAVASKNIIVAENGDIINLNKKRISLSKKKAPSNYIMVDGLGVGDVGKVVLRDRKVLAEDGIFVVIAVVDRETGKVKGSPDIISRGFVYLKESKGLLTETRKRVRKIINRASGARTLNWAYLKDEIKNKIGSYLYSKTQRRPMVLPVIIEV
jgi:ribonuclease J